MNERHVFGKPGGGGKDFLNFHPENWGKVPIFDSYCSNGLVQPPTRNICFSTSFGPESDIIWQRLSLPWTLSNCRVSMENFQLGVSSWYMGSLKYTYLGDGINTLQVDGHFLGGGCNHFLTYLGKWSNLTNIFQMGWNHQLVLVRISLKGIVLGKVIHHEKLLMEKKSETSMRSVSFEGEKGIDAGGLLRDWCLDLPIKIGGDLGWLETTKRWRFWYLGLFWSGQNNDDLSQGHLKWCFTEGIPSKSLI